VERNLPFSLSISFPNDIKKFSRNFLFSFPSFTPFSYILVRQKMAHWPVHKSKSAVPIFPLEVKRAGRWHNGQRTRPCKADLYTGGQVRRKMAHRPAQSTPDKTTLSDPHVFYAQPPGLLNWRSPRASWAELLGSSSGIPLRSWRNSKPSLLDPTPHEFYNRRAPAWRCQEARAKSAKESTTTKPRDRNQ